MGWPQVTFIAVWAFFASLRLTHDIVKKDGPGARFILEIISAVVVFGLLYQGGFFS